MPAAFIRSELRESQARTIVTLLDCCFSGSWAEGRKGADVDVRRDIQTIATRGSVVITASTGTEYAYEGNAERPSNESASASVFTEAIAEGLETGKADIDGDGFVALALVFHAVERAGVGWSAKVPVL